MARTVTRKENKISVKAAAKEVAKPSVKKSKEVEVSESTVDISDVYSKIFDETEKEYNLTSGEVDVPNKLSTNLLMLDTICGGGIGSFMTMFSGLEGGGKCLVGSTLVNTNGGFLHFKEFIKEDDFTKVKNMMISTVDGSSKVSHTFKSKSKTVKISTCHGFELEGTPEHPVLVLNESLDYVWRRLDALTTEDWIVTKSAKHNCLFGTDNSVSLSMATIMGYLTANGSKSTLSSGDARVIKRFSKAVKQETGKPVSITPGKGDRVDAIRIPGNSKGAFWNSVLLPLGYTGGKSKDKSIPKSIRQAPQAILHEYLESYFECDSGSESASICLTSASKKLINQLQVILLHAYNIRSLKSKKWKSAKNSKTPTERLYYNLQIQGEDACLFLKSFKRAKCQWNKNKVNKIKLGGSHLKQVPYVRKLTREAYNRVKMSDKPGDSRVQSVNGEILRNFRQPDYTRTCTSGHSDNPHATEYLFQREDFDVFLPRLAKIDPTLALKIKNVVEKDCRYERVVSIEHNSKEKPVYDVTVPKIHSFIANGLVSHNTSAALTILGSALDKNIPALSYYDAENAVSDTKYASVLMRYDADQIFAGDKKRVRIYRKSNLETFFNSARNVMRSLPDKIYRSDTKKWYHVFDNTKDSRALMARFGYKERSYDSNLYKLTGRMWCETDRKGLQGIVFLDSLAALVTTAVDEKDTGGGRAVTARAFSENFVKIMGLLKEKSVAFICTQQLREKPEASYGNAGPSYYEPSGNSAKFNSSLRCRFLPRAVPSKDGWSKGIGPSGYETSEWGEEKSWYSTTDKDKYKYILVKNTKNKLGTPNLENFIRICFVRGDGQPQGIDTAFDAYEFLRRTGRIEPVREKGKKRAFKVHMDEVKGKVFDFHEFKGMILAHQDKKLMKTVKQELGGDNIPDLRKALFKDIRTRKVYSMLKNKQKDSDDEDVDLEA